MYDLAYVAFFLYAYDDAEFTSDLIGEFNTYVTWMFIEMGKTVPAEFFSTEPEVVREARDAYSDIFVDGLHSIAESAFALVWFRKTLLYDFNRKLAFEIRPLRKVDHPLLETDGRLPRAPRFPSWFLTTIQKRDLGFCQHCGVPVAAVFGSDYSPHIDHMVALAQGGGNGPTNLILSCGPCNLSKGAQAVDIKDEFSWPNARP